MSAQLLLSSTFAASVDNFLSREPFQCSQNTSTELILLLWQRTGDLGHAVIALFFCFFFPPFSGHLKTCQHPLIWPLLNLTLTFPGDFPQSCERVSGCLVHWLNACKLVHVSTCVAYE